MKWWGWILLGAALVTAALFMPIPRHGHAQVASITLDWTAPGDDGSIGTASSYQMRWSSSRPDTTSQAALDAWWTASASVPSLPAPLLAGTRQSVTVVGPFGPGSYYFVMRASDEVLNWSAYSNVASKTILDTVPPGRVIDLITR